MCALVPVQRSRPRAGPVIMALAPMTASTKGAIVTVTGRNFGTSAEVLFDGTARPTNMTTPHMALSFSALV